MRRFFFLFIFLFVVGVTTGFAEPETRLQKGEGRDLVLATCTACHSEALVLKNHMTRERWDETLTWMQEKQGLWELAPDERKSILDYLGKYQGVQGTESAHFHGPSLYRYHYPPNPLAPQE